MNTTFDVLVIVLSCLLGLFLILSIVVAVLVIKLVRSVRRIVAKGEHLVDNAESAAEMFRNAAAPASLMRSVMSIIDAVTKHKKKGA